MVNKITSPITPLGEIDKINEIIDELDNIDPLPSQTGQSGKYLTTNGTVPSWADVQSLPSQTGKAGKFLQTDGTDASWESAPFRNIGEIVASTIPLTDAGLHLLDGALIQGSGIYSAFVTYIAGLVSTYPNLFVTESAWQSSVTTYGVCGKFVYDSSNNTVRLPKYSDKIYTQEIKDATPVVGNGNAVGFNVPNSASTYALGGTQYGDKVNLAGTFYWANGAEADVRSRLLSVSTDSTKSGLVTQLSDITTSLDGYYYIVIATSTKTDIQVDIDEVVTDLNGKADVDLLNITNSGKSLITDYCVPDYSNIVTQSVNTTYYADTNRLIISDVTYNAGEIGTRPTLYPALVISKNSSLTNFTVIAHNYFDVGAASNCTFTGIVPKGWYYKVITSANPYNKTKYCNLKGVA